MANEVKIKLTDEQKAKIKEGTGQDLPEIRVSNVGENAALAPIASPRKAARAFTARKAAKAVTARKAAKAVTARKAAKAVTARKAAKAVTARKAAKAFTARKATY
jgi:hypothetical protein